MSGGNNTFGYVAANPLRFLDAEGLDIAVIENGPTSGNPIGHTAVAISGHGVFSSGNGYPAGYDTLAYLAEQAARRDTKVFVIPTTQAQDKAALDELLRDHSPGSIPKTYGNCSDLSNKALDAAGVPKTLLSTIVPGSSGGRALAAGATMYEIKKGATSLPPALNQFGSKP